jgi:hypothetical protein
LASDAQSRPDFFNERFSTSGCPDHFVDLDGEGDGQLADHYAFPSRVSRRRMRQSQAKLAIMEMLPLPYEKSIFEVAFCGLSVIE